LSRWITGAALAACLSVHAPRLPVLASIEPEPAIVINAGRYGPYYHMRFVLTAAAIDFAASDRRASSGGQFTLRLYPEQFPIPAPHCRGALIIRMPWTAPNEPAAAEKIAAKRQLLARIVALAQTPHASVPVVVELNPYVEVTSRAPLRLQLTECNVFFRHALGGYVDHTGPL